MPNGVNNQQDWFKKPQFEGQQPTGVDPRQMLWAGTLADIGNFIANPFDYNFQGTGPAMMMQAMQYNSQAKQQNIDNQSMVVADQRAQEQHT